ncbi:MAG: hypothetical protein R2822_04230 [Spirosomataceae bacterium]
MSTAQILYEQFKVLPEPLKKELKALINSEEDIVEISLPALYESIRQVKLLKQCKLKTTSAREFLAEMKENL